MKILYAPDLLQEHLKCGIWKRPNVNYDNRNRHMKIVLINFDILVLRTLTGHKTNVRCLDFHPYGDFVASGSFDTNIKLWDIRKKGCMYTYKVCSIITSINPNTLLIANS